MKKTLFSLFLSFFSLSIMCVKKQDRVRIVLDQVVIRKSLMPSELNHYQSIKTNKKKNGTLKTTYPHERDQASYMEIAYRLAQKETFEKMNERTQELTKLGQNSNFVSSILDEIYNNVHPSFYEQVTKKNIWSLLTNRRKKRSSGGKREETPFSPALHTKLALITISEETWQSLCGEGSPIETGHEIQKNKWDSLVDVVNEAHKAEQ